MPEISRFLGIIIKMFYNEHNPPHFHAIYGKKEGVFSIEPVLMTEGKIPPRVQGLITEWANIHKKELKENWDLLKKHQESKKIKPLV